MIIWSRPSCAPPGTPFWAVHLVDASVHTLCRGMWESLLGDERRLDLPDERRGGVPEWLSDQVRIRSISGLQGGHLR